MKKLCLLIVSVFVAIHALSANIELITNNEKFEYSVDQLLEIQTKELVTLTPWTNSEPTFKGLSIAALFAEHNIQSGQIKFTALNDYSISVSVADLLKSEGFIAMYQDGEILKVRSKGPFWLIFPWSDRSELINARVSSWSTWQIKTIEHIDS